MLETKIHCNRRRIVTQKLFAHEIVTDKLTVRKKRQKPKKANSVPEGPEGPEEPEGPAEESVPLFFFSLAVPSPNDLLTPVFPLSNADFVNGTVRLRQPGRYLLTEDIVFNPNRTDDWRPRPDQAALYPPGKYHLGFFAALTLESPGIHLDGQGFQIRQSREHYLQQRFFACVELADQPFLPGQGPSSLGPGIESARDGRIENLSLGLSSHHSIHGNNNTRMMLKNITATQFEIAGIALNAPLQVQLEDLMLTGTTVHVPVRATYSQARFLTWDNLDLQASITLRGVSVSGAEIKAALEQKMQTTLTEWQAGQEITADVFRNPQGITDGNQYGLVLNRPGVAVGGVPTETSPGVGSVNLKRVTVGQLKGAFQEIPALPSDAQSSAYTQVQAGPVGDVFRYEEVRGPITDFYLGNVLSDAQIWLSAQGRGSISAETQAWAASGAIPLAPAYLHGNGDSMAHISKGSVGLLVLGLQGIRCEDVLIDGVHNNGQPSTLEAGDVVFEGTSAYGARFVACSDVQARGNCAVRDIVGWRAVGGQNLPVGFRCLGPIRSSANEKSQAASSNPAPVAIQNLVGAA